ncbi:zinc-binding dehydrogenase [Zwartia sp.]|uniref:quinone oxidoreductase family protein n=1 Tax=Zwartia sp. TaxID=2978004 RepID=UPI00271FCE26|nr:zinc-binding dehydrogenase [Zwartia sp.]MDO9025378.1 zinc-binding dehydrogenase [Zwartia sp.]
MKSYWMQTVENKTVLEMRDIEKPKPGPKQVLIRLHAASLNRGEFVIGHGLHKGGQASAIGMEGAGVVEAIGAEVKNLKIGDKIMGRCRGAFAEYACMDSVEAMPIPATLTFEQAASVPLTFLVVHDMLSLQGKLQPNEWLLIHGVSSGVGVAALQTAKAMGAKVIGTSGSPEKLARLKEHGLDLPLCLRGSGFEAAVMEATGGKGANLVVDTVGGSVFAESIRCMAFEGRFAMVGYVDGVLSAELDLLALHSKRLRLFGVSNKLRTAEQRAEFLPEFKAEVIPAIADGRIKPLVDHAFDFDQLEQAKEMMETNKHVGKIVLRMPVN